MFQRWLFICLAAALTAAPLTAAPAPVKGNSAATPAAKAAKKAKPKAKPKAAPGSLKPMPGPMGMHMPPMPPPSSATTHRQYDVPQAKTLSQTPDVVLNSRVRAALISGLSGIGAQDINPETAKGVVTLTGSVRTAQQRAQAEQVARKVHGIKSVKNKLAVKPGA